LKRHVASRRVLMSSLQAALLLRYSVLLCRSWSVLSGKNKLAASIRHCEMVLKRQCFRRWREQKADAPGQMLQGLQESSGDGLWTIKSLKPPHFKPTQPNTMFTRASRGANEKLLPAVKSIVSVSKEIVKTVNATHLSSPSGLTVISLSDLRDVM
jgi:hypothetical protein